MPKFKFTLRNRLARFFSTPARQARISVIVGSALLCTASLYAQAPSVLWRTNVNATLFAVDSQTNICANTNGTVITLNSLGVPFQTNSFCPVPSIAPEFAQRDSAGNFYFAGNFDGTNDFGGTNLVGGWINNINFYPAQWQPGYPTCFLAKYAPNGTLLWATGFGIQAGHNSVSDLVLNSDDSVTIAFVADLSYADIAHVSAAGSTLWVTPLPGSPMTLSFGPIKLTSLQGTNGAFLSYKPASFLLGAGYYTSSGSIAFDHTTGPFFYSSSLSTSGKPVTTASNEVYLAGLASPGSQPVLEEAVLGGSIISTQALGSVEQWVLNGDISGNLYLSGTDGSFSEYSSEGIQIWTTNYTSPSVFALSDAAGNRIVQFADNTIARLSADPSWGSPLITSGLQPMTVFTGSNAVFSIEAGGTALLHYYWFFNNAPLAAPDSPTLTIPAVTTSQGGSYYVVVSNLVNSVTSAPVQLQVKRVAIFVGGQMLTNGTYTLTNPVITIGSAFTNGSTFYTLDGSSPSSSSTPYSGPFSLNTNATIRAIGYSQDFSQSENADIVTAIVAIHHSLTASSPGGGSITLNPPGGDYPAAATVTATAVPDPGWTFLYWTGDVSGTNSSLNISMQSDQSIQAVFGTTLSTTVQGGGQVSLDPPGGLYPYGQVVELTAASQPGNSFAGWGNAVAGNTTNPLYFTIINATPTISSLFVTNSDSPARAPSVVWRTNVNATLFALDSQTNVYANANGAVIKLNSLGVSFQTNSFCPVPSIAPEFAQRDSAGNFYFAGNFDGTNDFGGTNLVGGWDNGTTPHPNTWTPGYPTCFLAKYAPNGALLWATTLGLQPGSNFVSDLVLNSDDSVTIAVVAGAVYGQIAQVSPTGATLWLSTVPGSGAFYNLGPVKLSALRGTNGAFSRYGTLSTQISLGYYTSSGIVAFNANSPLIFSSPLSTSGKPVTTPANEVYLAGLNPLTTDLEPIFQKAIVAGGIVWTQAVASVEQWTLNGDAAGNVYLSGVDGSFTKYDPAGGQIWTTNYSSPCVLGLSDSTGNQVVQFADKTIALLAGQPGSIAPSARVRQQAGDGAKSTGFRFSLSGHTGSVYQVFWSTDLTSWQSMGCVTNNTGNIQIVDPDSTNHLQKFYRVSP